MDGLTTNGVLVMHPAGGFSEDSAPGVWREISVCGNVYTLRDSRSAQQRGKLVGGLPQPYLPTSHPSQDPHIRPSPCESQETISSPPAPGCPNRLHVGACTTCCTEGTRLVSPSITPVGGPWGNRKWGTHKHAVQFQMA